MSDYNRVILMGRLTRDPELRFTPSNQPVAQIGIAVGRKYKTGDGEQREETAFVDCEAWGRTAEVMKQHLAKGRQVLVEGRLKLDAWETSDGDKRSKLKVVIEQFRFVGSKPDGGGQQQQAQQPVGQNAMAAEGGYKPISEDEIMF